jgi:molybdenum cofactor cytidylyltransferase
MRVAALVLAAGLSTRMGSPKLLLRWGDTTVLGRVLRTLRAAGITQSITITGSHQQAIAAVCHQEGSDTVHNPSYGDDEMLSSLQVGLRYLAPQYGAALIVLGDQPSMQAELVAAVLVAAEQSHAHLVVPSYDKRRGHPWLIRSELWQELLALHQHQTPRDFLRQHAQLIHYVDWHDDSVLRDIDTPEEYENLRPPDRQE